MGKLHIANMKKININFTIFSVISSIFFTIYLYKIILANIDFADARYILFMDEMISFDSVRNIFIYKSFVKFINSFLIGFDMRYGQIIYNISAITSYIPYLIWDDQGQIIATRLTFWLFLFSSYFILVWYLIKNNYHKIIVLSILMVLPYTPYYSSMPKPEPFQLFFLSLFLKFYFDKKHDHQKKYKYWIFLGLAFGAKVSVFPLILFLFTLEFIKNYKVNYKIIYQKFLFVFLGFVIAVPGIFLGKFKSYLNSTFLNSTHGADDSTINYFSWIKYFYHDYFLIPKFLTFIIFFICAVLLILVLINLFKQRDKIKYLINSKPIIIGIMALSFILPIMFFTKRIWGFYLHVGTVLLAISFFNIYQELVIKNKKIRLFFSIILVTVILNIIFFLGKNAFNNFENLSKRSKQESHLIKQSQYFALINFLENESKANGKMINYAIDPYLYIPQDNIYYKASGIWGVFTGWHKGFDFIIMIRQKLDTMNNIATTNNEYPQFMLSKTQRMRYEIKDNQKCLKKFCYIEFKNSLQGFEELIIFKKINGRSL
jgi:hypothetical protein